MALYGILNTNAYQGRYLSFEWSATQNVGTNQSTITWTLKGAGKASSGYYKAAPFEVYIDGEQVYSSSARINLYEDTLVASGTKVITHNTDGTRSFAASVKGAIYSAGINCSADGTFTLDNIPRAATITYAPIFNDTDAPTINLYNPAGYYSAIAVYMSLDGTANTIIYPYTVIDSGSQSFQFWLSDEARNTIYSNCATANSRDIYFHICTAIGEFYSDIPYKTTVNIVGAFPTLAPVVRDVGSISSTLTGNANYFINSYNVAECNSMVQAYKGAWISSQTISCGDKIVYDGYGVLDYITSPHITFSATDSRGNTVTQTVTVNWIDYTPLTCNLAIENPDTNGNARYWISGNYWSGNFGAVGNNLEFYYRIKETNGSYGEWQYLGGAEYANAENRSYWFEGTISGLDYRKSYTVQAVANDTIHKYPDSSIYTNEIVIKSIPVFDWSETDFNFNVPVTAPKFNVPQKVIWSGALYLGENQVAELWENVSAQSNGIVLIFSAYDSAANQVQDWHFCSYFIPKLQVSLLDGAPTSLTMSGDATMTYVSTKEVYITDNRIVGTSNNTVNGSNTTSGITYHNLHWALRYVLGV